jgi:hypothetical protein
VLSLTRASSDFVNHDVEKRMGIFRQPKPLNVALTRAENLFIVVGSPDVMWQDPHWRHWLSFVCRNGLWYGDGVEQAKKALSASSEGRRGPRLSVSTLGLEEVVVSTLEKIHRNTPTVSGVTKGQPDVKNGLISP